MVAIWNTVEVVIFTENLFLLYLQEHSRIQSVKQKLSVDNRLVNLYTPLTTVLHIRTIPYLTDTDTAIKLVEFE